MGWAMHTMTRYKALLYLSLLNFITTSLSFAEDQATSQPPPWPMWHTMPWHGFWWIIPLLFFVMMIVMCIFIMRGGMGCMWRNTMSDSSETRDPRKLHRGEGTESALEILDKRYARGEIDKQEYEEKKATITS
jgi:putative membrane protein